MGTENLSEGSFDLPLENKAIAEMMKLFLSCQRCSKMSTKPKQLSCTHTVCIKCVLSERKRNIESENWFLKCTVCDRVSVWRDCKGELTGLDNNVLMQQVIKQMTGNTALLNATISEQPGLLETDFLSKYGDRNMTVNIVSAVKEKIEIQEAIRFVEKKMTKFHQQARYVKCYEKKVEAAKAEIAQKIASSTDIMIATVLQEQSQKLANLDEIFAEELKPVHRAKEQIEKQMLNLELLTRCCEVASRILQRGGAPLDMENFKRMLQNSKKCTKEGILPMEMKHRYKCNIRFTYDERGFEEAVQTSRILGMKTAAENIPDKENLQDDNGEKYIVPVTTRNQEDENQNHIYDLPPDAIYEPESLYQESNCDEVIYDEIAGNEYGNFQTHVDEGYPDSPPPRPPKNNLRLDTAWEKTSEEQRAVLLLAERRRQATNGVISDTEEEFYDSFSSDTETEISSEPSMRGTPTLPVRTIPLGKSNSNPYPNYKVPSRESLIKTSKYDPCSSNSSDGSDNCSGYHSGGEKFNIKRGSSLKHRPAVGLDFPQVLKAPLFGRNKFLFSIGKIRKTGYREPLAFTVHPIVAAGIDGKLWITDTNNNKVQEHESTCGNLVSSFKTVNNGVALKPRGICALDNGEVATTCGKCVIIWSAEGKYLRKFGPRSDMGKLAAVSQGSNKQLVVSDIENVQILVEGSRVRITAIGGQIRRKPTWPGQLVVNRYNQIITPDYTEHCVKIFNMEGSLLKKFGSFGTRPGQMRYPSAVALDQQNRIYVADECNNRVTVFSPDGSICYGDILTKQDGINFPHSIAVLNNGRIAVSDDSKLVKVYRGFKE